MVTLTTELTPLRPRYQNFSSQKPSCYKTLTAGEKAKIPWRYIPESTHDFFCMAKQEDAPLLPQLVRNDALLINGLLPIILGFYKVTEIRSRVNNDAYLHGPETLLATRSMSVFSSSIKLLSERPYYTKLIADHLSGMGVPQRVRPSIIQEIFRAVDVAVPDIVIDVTIGDRTTLIYGDYARTIEDRVISESLEGYKAKLIPATKSSIDGLEKVRVDSFQGEEEGSRPKKRSRQSCVICLDPLDAATASCAEEEGRDKTINRLPCSHLYHGDCIVKWLNINHVRPMCRYPMPTVEEAKPLQ